MSSELDKRQGRINHIKNLCSEIKNGVNDNTKIVTQTDIMLVKLIELLLESNEDLQRQVTILKYSDYIHH